MLRTYRYRLYPSRSQEQNLWRVLDACRGLYNMALAERKHAYQLEECSVSKAELYDLAKHYRKTFPHAMQMFSQTAQSVIEQVDAAFEAFFRRVKAGEKPGFPRFKGRNRFNSFLFKQFGNGAKLDGRRLKLYGIGRVRVRGMVRNRHLSKSILDSGWATFRQYLAYKAESAGREVALVDPAYTSKCCSQCDAVFQDFDLSTRWVTCACGLSLDRDHNAARNILRRAGWDTSVPDNVAPLFAPRRGEQGQASVRSPRL